MKRILYLTIVSLLSSCLSEKNAEPSKPSTFVRYFNGGNNDFAQVAEEITADGNGDLIILATTKIDVASADSSKIKLIKTDRYGSTLFQKVYPAFGSTTTLAGNALLKLPSGGFVVAGTEISSTRKDLYLMEVDSELNPLADANRTGKKIDFAAFDNTITQSIQAKAIQFNKDINGVDTYLVLASIEADTYNMLLAEINTSTFAINWVKKYGAGTSSLGHKLFADATPNAPNVFWSGTVTRNSTDIRLVKTAQNSLNTIFDLPIGTPQFREEGHDMCKYGLGFIVVGNSNESGNQDIHFKILTENGSELHSKTISDETDTPNDEKQYAGADTGNAVCATNSGFVVLGTVGKTGHNDYFLMKYDGFGNEAWAAPRIFGNTKRNDTGASVEQLADGSLLVLGTTVFGGVNTLMLMRANAQGEIE